MSYDQYDGEIGAAKSYMVHYFKVLFERSGINWNEDNESEIESMVEAIVAAAAAKVKAETASV